MQPMTFETIKLSVNAVGVARLTLSRPDIHNALNPQMFADLDAAITALDGDPAVRVVVLTGEGESFCAGGDFRWQQSQRNQSREERIRAGRPLAEVLRRLNSLSKPLIGRINGPAYGGGVGLISVCDIAVAVNTVRIALTEVRLGLVPATIAPYVAAKLGESNSRRVFLNAKPMTAEQALRYGLIHEVATPEKLDEAVDQEINQILSCAPGAIATTKKLVDFVLRHSHADNLIYTVDRLADFWETAEAQEGMQSFFEKRKPAWHKTHGGK